MHAYLEDKGRDGRIKMGLRAIGYENGKWVELAQDHFCISSVEPWGSAARESVIQVVYNLL
jgi:hypothetical protein